MGNENSKCGCCKNNKINEIQFSQENVNENQNIENSINNQNPKIDSSKDLKSYVNYKNNIDNSFSPDDNSLNNKKSSSI